MTNDEAIERIRYRINTATDMIGKGIDGNAYEDMEMAIKALKDIKQYQAICTVEEYRKLIRKQMEVKPVFEMNFGDYESRFVCKCGKKIVVRHDRGVMNNNDAPNYCSNCGQKLKWI